MGCEPEYGRSREVLMLGEAMPATRHARSGEVSVAYQVFGEGPRDLIVIPG
jgi:hypothetical protein